MTGFLDFVHCPEFCVIENTTFQKLGLLSSSGDEMKTPTLLGLLRRANISRFVHWVIKISYIILHL
jgi:RAB protein geranylgeranyltransferase component A